MQNLQVDVYKDNYGNWAIQLYSPGTDKSFIYNIAQSDAADIEKQIKNGFLVKTEGILPDRFDNYIFAPAVFADARDPDMCTICQSVPVDTADGYDTCKGCAARI